MDKKTLLILGVIAIAAVLLLRKQTPTYVAPVTGNVSRDSKVNNILAYATAAGATATAIANLIQQLQGSSDSQVDNIYAQTQSAPPDSGLPAIFNI